MTGKEGYWEGACNLNFVRGSTGTTHLKAELKQPGARRTAGPGAGAAIRSSMGEDDGRVTCFPGKAAAAATRESRNHIRPIFLS